MDCDKDNRLDAKIQHDWFVRSYLDDISPIRTKDQVDSIYSLLCSKWMVKDDEIKSFRFCPSASVFNVLLHFTAPMLREYHHEPVCRYEDLLRWHELTTLLGEDMFTTSFLAAKDLESQVERKFFNWKDIISHDNAALNSIFQKRMIDLHYHLYGSIFVFDLNWLSLMNDVDKRKDDFLHLHDCLFAKHILSESEKKTSLYQRVMKAAAIRLLLFWYLDGSLDEETIEEYRKSTLDILDINEDILMSSVKGVLQQRLNATRFAKGYEFMGNNSQKKIIDYAIIDEIMVNSSKDSEYIYSVLSGERNLMYHMFRKIYDGQCSELMSTLFYIYLLVKSEFRTEIVQLNDSVGFANFSDYQGRKMIFLKRGSVLGSIATQIAVASSLPNPERELEARIVPGNSFWDLCNSLHYIEGSVKRGVLTYCSGKDLAQRYTIILHFIKRSDDKLKRKTNRDAFCRHYELRNRVKKQSLAIHNLLRIYANQGKCSRVVGIDAASSEIACRPEVFGQSYRFLKNSIKSSQYSKIPSDLGFTFHVGEDFLDIVDGLRAISESLLFLNLENRDRLGHALVLGTDAYAYYAKRGHYISMTKQMFLDNIVWLYFEGSTCDGFNMIAVRLRTLYFKYYHEIYEKSIALLKNDKRIRQEFDTVTMEDYFQSWLLRGDNPEKYRSPQVLDHTFSSYYDLYAFNERKAVCEARRNIKARYLYHLYHYGELVYEEGNKSDQIKVDEDFIYVIQQMQKKLLCEIERLHLSIETNPTSNYRIGDFTRYDEHPILQFFNYGLNHGDKPEHSITVSINTDDKGVFSTSLEREFSVMAAALEKKCDVEKGANSPRMIYDWLDRVREMAFEMKFGTN